jgi:hypothetical protein
MLPWEWYAWEIDVDTPLYLYDFLVVMFTDYDTFVGCRCPGSSLSDVVLDGSVKWRSEFRVCSIAAVLKYSDQ